MIQVIMEETLNQVRIQNQFIEKFPTVKGLKQEEDGLAPILFILALEKVIRAQDIRLIEDARVGLLVNENKTKHMTIKSKTRLGQNITMDNMNIGVIREL